MRRVYDDKHYEEVAQKIFCCLQEINTDPASVSEYDYGTYRAKSRLIWEKIAKTYPDIKLGRYANTTGIGNNACYELIVYDEASGEEHICALYHATDNMYGSQICWVSDIDKTRRTESVKIHGRDPKERR